LALMGIVLFTGASTTMIWPLLVVYLQEVLKAEFWVIGAAYLPAALLSAFLPSRMGCYSDRLGRKLPMITGLLVSALASMFLPHLRSVLILTAIWAVESLGWIIASPAERAFVADIAGEDARGRSYGWYTFAYYLGSVVGPLVGGWLYDTLGHSAPFYLNAAILVGGSFMVLTLLHEPKTEVSENMDQGSMGQ
jgi:DHA1 family multidrug resistance protein-like MFS transporter